MNENFNPETWAEQVLALIPYLTKYAEQVKKDKAVHADISWNLQAIFGDNGLMSWIIEEEHFKEALLQWFTRKMPQPAGRPLDMSKLSVMTMDKIMNTAIKTLRDDAARIDEDVKYFSPSEARTEMEGWRDAASKLADELRHYQIDLSKKQPHEIPVRY